MEKIRIAIASYSLNSTQGLSYVAKSLLERFMRTERYECAFITVGGEDTTEQGLGIWGDGFLSIIGKLTIANCQLFDKNKVHFFDEFIKTWKPDILISICDPWMHDQYAYSAYRNVYYWITYQHIETPEYPEWVMMPTPVVPLVRKSIKNMMGSANLIIPVTDMGKNTLLKFGFNHITNPIYNGLDIDNIITENITKKQAFDGSVLEDDFVFMTMGVNNERKKIDRTLEAFSKFLKLKGNQKQKYKLYLHSPLDIQQGGTDLKEIITKLQLQKNILIINDYKKDIGINKEALYMKYKACDCFILLTGGEGFGLGYLEAIANNKPVIYTDYGGHTEFCKDRGLSVPVRDYTNAANGYIKFALADTDIAANKMVQISSDKKLYNKLSQGGYDYVKENFNWDNIFINFETLILKKYDEYLVDKIPFILKRII